MTKLFCRLVLLFFFCLPAWADVAGQVVYLSGTLSAKKTDGTSRLLTRQSSFNANEILNTAKASFARLKFIDGTEVAMRPNTSLDIKQMNFKDSEPDKDSLTLGLLKGGMRSVTGIIGKRNKQKIRYETPVATIGIRGTHFGLLYCTASVENKDENDCSELLSEKGKKLRNGLHADVAHGSIEISNDAGTLVLKEGEFGYVADRSTAPVMANEDEPFILKLPSSVMFDTEAQIWSGNCMVSNCSAR